MLGVFVEMQPGARRYVVAGDSKETDLQRSSLLAAAAKRGMQVVLPDAAALAGVGANDSCLRISRPQNWLKPRPQRGGEVVLIARLVWDDQELRWNTDWQLDWQGRPHRWQLAAVTFDEAFRQGIGAAAQILAGQQ